MKKALPSSRSFTITIEYVHTHLLFTFWTLEPSERSERKIFEQIQFSMRVKNVLWNAALVFFCDCDDAHVFTFSFGNDYPYPRYGTIFFSVSTWTNQLVMRDKMLSFEETLLFAPFAPFAFPFFPLGSNFLCIMYLKKSGYWLNVCTHVLCSNICIHY